MLVLKFDIPCIVAHELLHGDPVALGALAVYG